MNNSIDLPPQRTINDESKTSCSRHSKRSATKVSKQTMSNACATCASRYDVPTQEKPAVPGRQLPCCLRSICTKCLNQNQRYQTYCPYCQITTKPSLLPQGLRDPPAYSSLHDNRRHSPPPSPQQDQDEQPPAYSSHPEPSLLQSEKPSAPDVLHFLTTTDTMLSISLAYGVPLNALRKTNNVFSDHLIRGRKTILIPGEYYKNGVSLSPRPVDGEEEDAKKNKIRRWMVTCKVSDYDVAVLYLKQAQWELDMAVEEFQDDEQWEKDHPLHGREKHTKGKLPKETGMRRFVGSGSRAHGR